MKKIAIMAAFTAALSLGAMPAVAAPDRATAPVEGSSLGGESEISNVLWLALTAVAVVSVLAITGGEENSTPVSV